MMARALYSLLLWLASPFVWLRLLWRGRRQPEYLSHRGERWGFYKEGSRRPVIWVHAVSVGETRAAEPLIRALAQRFPDHRLLLTAMTPTGREAGRQLFGDTVSQAYLPYDYPGSARRFLRHFRPQVGLLMETEVWPNLLSCCEQAGIPVMLVNARLSERSARGYRRLAPLTRPAFAALTGCAAQTPADGRRLADMGVRDVSVVGNLKFDVEPPQKLIALGRRWREQAAGRPVWLAASTREGEEVLILDAWRRLAHREAVLVLVPRHPQRFDEVAALAEQAGAHAVRRTIGLPTSDTQIWLGDSMGEMPAYYAMADLAFIGGSLLPLGGQNLIEAAACGCAVLIGPHTFNFAQATEDAIAAGAARRIMGAAELADAVDHLLARRGDLEAMRQAAVDYAAAHRGATARTIEFISRRWDPAMR